MLESWFKLRQHGTTVGTEVVGGATTFLVMAYIIFVNPAILSFAAVKDLQGKGPEFAATLAATCLVAGVMTIFVGLWAKYPFAIAPGMGLNAVVAFQLIVGLKLPWQAAMGVILMEGVAITVLVLTGFREAVMHAIPMSLKRAIGVGIGLFILFIGLVEGDFIRWGSRDIGTPVALGNLTTPAVLVAVIGLLVTIWLMAKKVNGALLIGIIATTIVGIIVNAASGFTAFTAPGVAVLPTSIIALPNFSTFGQGLNFEIFAKVGVLAAVLTIFSIMLADFFDTMGTVIGIGGQAGWLDEKGRLPRLNRVLLVDSLAAVFGGFSSSSSATTYIESAAGVSQGARTGLASVVTGILFLLALFIAPLAGVIPPHATAAALIVVGFLMCTIVKDIPFDKFEEGLPALLIMTVMPFTYSITNGIGAGFVAYVFIKLVMGKAREVNWMMYLAALGFAIYFLLPWLQKTFSF
ncbi:MAG: NCS2 family permease [Chloroflexi bacterium]|nr:NCS2 family permease [Chloroflexota bacterium]